VTYEGHALQKWLIWDPVFTDKAEFTFSDTVVGPIDPAYYQPPKLDCPPPPFDKSPKKIQSGSSFLKKILALVM